MLDLKEECYNRLDELRASKDMSILNTLGFMEGKDLDKFIFAIKDIIKYAPENCSYVKNAHKKLVGEYKFLQT